MPNQTTLSYRGDHLGEVEVTGQSGQRSLDGGRLIFNCRMRLVAQPERRVTFIDVGGDLILSKPGVHIGRLFPFNAIRGKTETQARDHHFTVSGHLNTRELLDLERMRAQSSSASLELEVRLEILMVGNHGYDTGQAWMSLTISQSDWMDCLRGMQFEDRVLIEFPTEGGRLSGPLATAAEHYRRALGLQYQANWPQVVGECRRVVEAIATALNLQSPPADQWQQGQRQKWDLRTRIEHARAAIHHVCHLANHAGVEDDPSAEDARLVMALAGSLLRYYAERSVR